ncbi:hypothetical protein [Nocardioides flavescens]|uniref:EfeO-type cupredoxin-like domain-containing protein n=1 Tax=Nocardioides flavescens TaxID=2691959 RepID=A0A6L7F418_9ACTN|nr:hypothetical protein [Nocardioides flavescens]MXG91978.1 hypothetical protein [Nocardioides flavescens]
MRTIRRTSLPTLALAATLALAGCGSDDTATADQTTASATPTAASETPTETPSETPTETPTGTPTETPTETEPAQPAADLVVTVQGDDVTPNAQELTVQAGEPLTIEFTSDRAGELHVHAKPEQYVEFGEGTTTAELTIDVPGSVEIEEHETGAVVALLEVQP